MRSFVGLTACVMGLVVVACSGSDDDIAVPAPAPVVAADGGAASPPTSEATSDLVDSGSSSLPDADAAVPAVAIVGNACTKPDDCESGNCVDGVCCNTKCTDACKSCNNEGSKGICSDVAYYVEDPFFVGESSAAGACRISEAGGVCDGKGQCLKVSGKPCQTGAHCISGKCVDLKCLGAKGEFCNLGKDCVSGLCTGGACG